jgi:hypothetical protein
MKVYVCSMTPWLLICLLNTLVISLALIGNVRVRFNSVYQQVHCIRSEVFTAVGCGALSILCEPTFRRRTYPEDGGDTFLRDVCSHKIYTAPHPRRRHSSSLLQSDSTTRPIQCKAGSSPVLKRNWDHFISRKTSDQTYRTGYEPEPLLAEWQRDVTKPGRLRVQFPMRSLDFFQLA